MSRILNFAHGWDDQGPRKRKEARCSTTRPKPRGGPICTSGTLIRLHSLRRLPSPSTTPTVGHSTLYLNLLKTTASHRRYHSHYASTYSSILGDYVSIDFGSVGYSVRSTSIFQRPHVTSISRLPAPIGKGRQTYDCPANPGFPFGPEIFFILSKDFQIT